MLPKSIIQPQMVGVVFTAACGRDILKVAGRFHQSRFTLHASPHSTSPSTIPEYKCGTIALKTKQRELLIVKNSLSSGSLSYFDSLRDKVLAVVSELLSQAYNTVVSTFL